MVAEQLAKAFGGGEIGRVLRHHIAPHLVGHAGVGEHHREDVAVDLALPAETHRQDAETFLEGLRHAVDLLRARCGAADIHLVSRGGDIAEQVGSFEDGHDLEEVGEMPGPHPAVVHQDAVAGLQRLRRIGLGHMADDEGHGAQMARREIALGDHPALCIEHRGGEVVAFADSLAEGSVAHGRAEFFRDGNDRVPDDGEGDGVDGLSGGLRFFWLQNGRDAGAAAWCSIGGSRLAFGAGAGGRFGLVYLDQQMSACAEPRAVAGQDESRRLCILDDRRAVDHRIRADGVAPPHRSRRHAPGLGEPGPPHTRRFAGNIRGFIAANGIPRILHDGCQRPVHALDRALRILRAVTRLVGCAKGRLAGCREIRVNRAVRQIHMDFKALPAVPHVGEPPEDRRPSRGQVGEVLSQPRLEPGVDGRNLFRRGVVETHEPGHGSIQPALGCEHANGRPDAGGLRDHDPAYAQSPRHPGRMQRPRTAEGHQRITARVPAPLDGNDAQSVLHIAGGNQMDTPGGLLNGQA